jgi:hypothetical protein
MKFSMEVEIPRHSMEYFMEFHGQICQMFMKNSMEFRDCMEFSIPFSAKLRLMEFHGIPWNSVKSWNFIKFGFDRVYSCVSSNLYVNSYI